MSFDLANNTLWVILGPFAASAAWTIKAKVIAKRASTARRRCEKAIVDGEVFEEGRGDQWELSCQSGLLCNTTFESSSPRRGA